MNEVKTFSNFETLVVLRYKSKIKLVVVVSEKDLKKMFKFINNRLTEILNPQRVVTEILKEFNSYFDVFNVEKTLSLYTEARMIHIDTGDGNKVKLYADSVCEVLYDFF